MRKTILAIMAALVMLPMAISAQENKETKSEATPEEFKGQWFISVGAGPQLLIGDDDHKGNFGDRISPALNVSVGKWLMPGLGFRLEYSGLSAKGWGYGNGGYIFGDMNDEYLYKEKFNYMNFHVDALVDLTNMIGGYRENRVYRAIPYAGIGLVHRFDADVHGDKKTFFGINMGYQNKFRLAKNWDFNLEANALLMNDYFDSKVEGINMDALINVTAGFTYKFNGKKPKAQWAENEVSAAEMEAIRNDLNDQIARNEALEKDMDDQLAAEKARNKALADQLAAEKDRRKAAEAEAKKPVSPRTIFFNINEAKISPKEKVNIRYVAEQIKANPNRKFTVTGYADNATGTPEFNQKLTQARAEAVYNMLVDDYGVNKDQLEIIAKGGADNMYESNELNRVVIVE